MFRVKSLKNMDGERNIGTIISRIHTVPSVETALLTPEAVQYVSRDRYVIDT